MSNTHENKERLGVVAPLERCERHGGYVDSDGAGCRACSAPTRSWPDVALFGVTCALIWPYVPISGRAYVIARLTGPRTAALIGMVVFPMAMVFAIGRAVLWVLRGLTPRQRLHWWLATAVGFIGWLMASPITP
jgi:hypothetical protein